MAHITWPKVVALLAALFLAGCASEKNIRVADAKVNLVAVVNSVGSSLIKNTADEIPKDKAILATSFVNIDDLQRSSTFGRLIGDSIAGDLVGKGYEVIEVRLRNSLFMQPRIGEFMLSRELMNVGAAHDAQAVLVGTYAVGGDYVYVNARLVSVADSRVLSSHDFRLPLNRDIRKMLTNTR